MDSLRFLFDGKDSEDFGLNIIKMESGFYPSPYIMGQAIVEDHIADKHLNYFYGVKKEPISFRVTFSLLDEEFTSDKKFDLARWLVHEEFKPFQTFDDLDKYYYVIATEQSDFISGGNQKGYFTIHFRTNDPWAYTRRIVKTYDLSTITEPENIIMVSKANAVKYYYPELEIEICDYEGDIELINKSNKNKVFKFEDLNDGEIIYIDNLKHKIISDNLSVHSRLNNFNKGWLELVYGRNKIEVKQPCKLKLITEFPIYA